MYKIFSLLKRIWIHAGMPCERTVRHVRHAWIGRFWPAKSMPNVSVIIPTAGTDIHRLEKCISALYKAANNVNIQPIVVVAPANPKTTHTVQAAVGNQATVLALPTFNYPNSLNEGLKHRAGTEYTLLLNDDCFFTQEHSIQKLIATLTSKQWACIGPWVRNEEREDGIHLRLTRSPGAVQLTEPVPGMCVLWDNVWIERIGAFDTQFGEGYGCDEADYSLRARNRGARWGRDDAVEVHHLHHATFGSDAHISSPKHQHNLSLWRQKYPGIDSWGKGIHWQSLPGIHIAIAGHNVSKWIERTLQSIEQTLNGYRWILTYADDASTDDSLQKVLTYPTSAQQTIVRQFPKACSAAEAKNRAIGMGRPFSAEYPVLCLMDADDVMLPARIDLLLPHMHDRQCRVVFGDYICTNVNGDHTIYSATSTMQEKGVRLHPCSTLIDWSLIPQNNALFSPNLTKKEDEHLWQNWHQQGIDMEPVAGACVHHYIERFHSVMRGSPEEELRTVSLR